MNLPLSTLAYDYLITQSWYFTKGELPRQAERRRRDCAEWLMSWINHCMLNLDVLFVLAVAGSGLSAFTYFCWITENWMFYWAVIVSILAVIGLSMV